MSTRAEERDGADAFVPWGELLGRRHEPNSGEGTRARALVSSRVFRSLLLCCSLQAAPALPQEREPGDCRLALVLALDVSSSVDAADDRLQREGLAAALLAPEVVRAFLTGGPVALYAFEWAGASSQAALLPGWETIGSEQDLVHVASVIRQGRRSTFGDTGGGTAVGAALVHAAAALAAGPDCRARTVDVAGDGVNNDGIEPRAVIEARYDGITVNALIVRRPHADPLLEARLGDDGQLVGWFIHAVLHGPEAFHVVADGYEDYERAMTAKLLRELELPLVSGLPLAGNGA